MASTREILAVILIGVIIGALIPKGSDSQSDATKLPDPAAAFDSVVKTLSPETKPAKVQTDRPTPPSAPLTRAEWY